MTDSRPLTILCLASYEKGAEFMRECRRQNCRVLLLTSESIAHADWPRESIDEVFLIPDVNKKWKLDDVIKGVSFLARTETKPNPTSDSIRVNERFPGGRGES